MAKLPRYLFPSDYMADPAAHVFNGKYISIPHTTGRLVPLSMMMVVTSR